MATNPYTFRRGPEPSPCRSSPHTAHIGAPFQRHSETSEAAAKAIEPALGQLHANVWAAVMASSEGLTDEEICERTGLEGNTVRPRRVELERLGHLAPVGKRPTKSGRLAVVWAATVPPTKQAPAVACAPERDREATGAPPSAQEAAPTDSGELVGGAGVALPDWI